MPTFQQTETGYGKLWDSAQIKPSRQHEVATTVDRIMLRRSDYAAIQGRTGVPWFMVAALHMRESGLSFKTHLHNGDPLTARTYHVPSGRPKDGNPPFDFKDSAEDALTMAPHSLNKVPRWSVERMLYEQEKYNGFGYIKYGENSPYVWAATTEQESGKFVADGKYDPNATDTQLGTAVVMKEIAARDPGVAERLKDREASPPKDVIAQRVEIETRNERTAVKAGTAGGVAGGTAKATIETPSKPAEAAVKHVTMGYLVPVAIALCVVVVIVAIIRISRKKETVPAAVAAKWGA